MANLANLLPNLFQQFKDANGVILAGGSLYSYAAGTTTPLATYTDSTEATPNANPIVLDASGSANIWIGSSSYKFVLKDSSANTIWTVDNVQWINNNFITAQMIANGAIGTTQIASLAVTTALLADGAVTTAKIADANVTTAKIADANVTVAKLDPAVFNINNFSSLIEVVFKNKGDFSDGKIIGTPQFPWSAPAKVSDPSTLPAAGDARIGRHSWSPCGEYLAVAVQASDGVLIYQRSGSSFKALSSPLPGLSASCNSVAWSPNGRFLAVASTSSPYLLVYVRAGNTFTLLPAPATGPTGIAHSVAWSPNGQFLAVGHETTPYISIYQVSGGLLAGSMTGSVTGTMADISALSTSNTYTDAAVNAKITLANLELKELQSAVNKQSLGTFTKLTNPVNLPAGIGFGLSWSSSGQYLAVAHETTPFVTVYSVLGAVFTKLSDPATLPAAATDAFSVSWSPDESLLAVGYDATPYLTVYQRSGAALTKIANPASLPPGLTRSLEFSPNGAYLALSGSNTPFTTIYSVSGTTLTKLADPVALGPSGGSGGGGLAWSPNAQFLAQTFSATPFVIIWQTASTIPTSGLLWTRQVNNV